MTKKILNKNIYDIIRIPAFWCFILVQVIFGFFVICNQVTHLMLEYLFLFNIILLYFLSAYLSAKFLFSLKKNNVFAFIFMKPISKAYFALVSMFSVLLVMVVPLFIFMVTIFVANVHQSSIDKYRSEVVLSPDLSVIEANALQVYGNHPDIPYEKVYKEFILADSTVLPMKTGEWTFVVPKNLWNKKFSLSYNNMFNVSHRLNTNSFWVVLVDQQEVFKAGYKSDESISHIFVAPLSELITVKFINNSGNIPILFVSDPVNLVFDVSSFPVNLLKGGIKTLMNISIIISISFMMSIFMSVPGLFFSVYLSIVACMFYKLFYLKSDSSFLLQAMFKNGIGDVVNSVYIRGWQIFLFAFIISVINFLVVKISEHEFQSDSFYMEHK